MKQFQPQYVLVYLPLIKLYYTTGTYNTELGANKMHSVGHSTE